MISAKFIKSSLIYTLAGALPMASALILLPFYIAYLPTDTYGVLSICLAFSMLVQIIVTYSFDTSLYIHYHEFKDEKEKLSQFISSVFIFMSLLSIGVVIFFVLTGEFVFSALLKNRTFSFYPYGLISVGIGISQAIFKVHGNLLQTREKPSTFLWSNVVSFSIIAISTIVGLKIFPGSLIGPLGGRLLAGIVSSCWVYYRVFNEFGFHAHSPWTSTSKSFNAYTFVYQLQQWSINYLDRFLILFFLPLSSVGVYDFAMKCVVPVELMLNGLNASINPKVVSAISKQEVKHSSPEVNRYFYGLVSAIILIVCFTIIVVPAFLEFFIPDSGYAKAIEYIPYVALIYIFKSMRLFFVLPFTILKKMQRLTILNFFITFIKVGLMILLIMEWKIYGLIMSAYLAYAIEICLLGFYLRDYYLMKFNAFKLIVAPLTIFILILIVETYLKVDNPIFIHLFYGALSVILLTFAYRNELKLLTLKISK